MTLVLTCATQEYVVLVCDRRLVTGRGDVRDDNANKAVVFDGRMALSYTGLGQIASERTDLWLTTVLASSPDGSLPSALRTIRSAATSAFSDIDLPLKVKRHAFVGIGWTRRRLEDPFSPILCRVSNFHDESGAPLPVAQDAFGFKCTIVEPNTICTMLNVGQGMPASRESRLLQRVHDCVSGGYEVDDLLKLLVVEMRDVAERVPAVGRGLLSVILPRSIVDSPLTFYNSGPPVADAPTFQYFPAGRSNGIICGPNFAAPGSGAANFQAGPL